MQLSFRRALLDDMRRIFSSLKAQASSLCVIVWLALAAADSAAEDRVVLMPLKSGGTRTTLRGEIVDYRGDGLRFRSSSGKEDTYDSARIVELVTTWPEALALGETAWRGGEWNEAIIHYRTAAAEEKRAWAKRRMLGRLVECLRDARRIAEAGDAFLALYRADPETPEFGVIPLDWTLDVAAATAVETHAREWLKQDAVSPAVLLGASWLLSRAERPKAQAALRRLSSERDARIAHLADAQLWRTRLASADRAELDKWQTQIERMPDSLRAGPTFVFGQGLGQREEANRAAIELLRIPILWNDQRELAAVALWEAGRILETTPTPRDADGLYREIVSTYPASSIAEAARKKLLSTAERASNPTPRTP